MSAADLMAVLLAKYLHYDFATPKNPHNDHLIFSKGHASPLLYAMYRAAGAISDDELLSYRKRGSRLEGHPTPALPWVDVATGSLGQGLPIGVGVALAGKRLDRLPYRVWVLTGDSELAEGSMWEAFEHAEHHDLDNLTAVLDINRLGQRGETMHGWDLDYFDRRLKAIGWHTIEIDGHDVAQIDAAFAEGVSTKGKPTAVIARTIKGKGVAAVADKNGFHGKAIEDADAAIRELGGRPDVSIVVAKPTSDDAPHRFETRPSLELPRYDRGAKEATRKAYGDALAALGAARGDVVVLDGEVSNSTYAEVFAKQTPDRYFEMYIAEQQMAAAAVGMQVRGWKPFASSFAAFWSRAYDFIRMAAVSRANIRICGSHAGVSIGEDGPSQMALEDLAAFRAVWSSTVLYPCDANQTAKLVARMADRDGIVYLRTTREKTPVIYSADEEFLIGGSRVLRRTTADTVTIVGAGITVHEALTAADRLSDDGIAARVIDLFSIKPIDRATLLEAAADTGAIITVEDHWPEGGLGEAVLSVFGDADDQPRVVKLAVRALPGSATPAQQLADAGIDAAAIVDAARALAARVPAEPRVTSVAR
jgi:transketolase